MISSAFVTGTTGPIPSGVAGTCDPTTGAGFGFFGGAGGVRVSNLALGANQLVSVTGAADLGGAASVSNLLLDICYQSATTGFVADGKSFGTPTTPLSLPGGARLPFQLSKTLSLPASDAGDSYTVGLCGCINSTTDLWTSDFSWLNVQVIQK